MKYFLALAVTLLCFTACTQQAEDPKAVSDEEFVMAEQLGISVEELRNQTPEEHMEMMQHMMMQQQMNQEKMHMQNDQFEGFLPGEGIDSASLPVAQPPSIIQATSGSSIELNPMLVRKKLGDKEFVFYAYNGQIPGPSIVAEQGTTFTVSVTNSIGSGVTFPQLTDTTVHWHGLRHDNSDDGVPGITQDPIHSGETYTYTVTVPDEGLFWYHPHVREDIQQDLGLYGAILVRPTNSNAYDPVHEESLVVLDDILLDNDKNPVPYGIESALFPLMGRYGNQLILNGEPAGTFHWNIPQGSVIRFYVLNVANTRTFNIHFPAADATRPPAKMKLVGDDIGRYENTQWTDYVPIAPAERRIIDVQFDGTGSYLLEHASPLSKDTLALVTVSDASDQEHIADFATLHSNEDVIADIDHFRKFFTKEVDKTLVLDITMMGSMMHMNHSMMQHGDDDSDVEWPAMSGVEWPAMSGVEWPAMSGVEWEDSMPGMNAMSSKLNTQWNLIDQETGQENMDIQWVFQKGDVVKVRIINKKDSAHPMQHPIHFHGQRFLVLSVNGKQNDNLAWKDTVLVPRDSTVDVLFDMSNPGDWMFHCHIAEHLTNGMMGMLQVLP